MLPPAIQRIHIVVAQGKDDTDRLRIRIKIVEERILSCDQAGNRRRDTATKQDTDSIANLFHESFPLGAAREDFLKLVNDAKSRIKEITLDEARVQFGIWRAYFSGAGNRMLVATVIQLAFSPVMLRP